MGDALTWDEFLDVCKRLTLDGNGNNAASSSFDPNNIVQYGFNLVKDYDGWGSWILNNGGKYYSEDGKQFTMNDPKCVNASIFSGPVQRASCDAQRHHGRDPEQQRRRPIPDDRRGSHLSGWPVDPAWTLTA